MLLVTSTARFSHFNGTGGGHQHCSPSGDGKHVGQFAGDAGVERQVGFSHPTH